MDAIATITHTVPTNVYDANDGDNDVRLSFAPGHDTTRVGDTYVVTQTGQIDAFGYVWVMGDYSVSLDEARTSAYYVGATLTSASGVTVL